MKRDWLGKLKGRGQEMGERREDSQTVTDNSSDRGDRAQQVWGGGADQARFGFIL